jgi:hypothetical protein
VCGAVADLAPDLQFYVQIVFGKGRKKLPAFRCVHIYTLTTVFLSKCQICAC